MRERAGTVTVRVGVGAVLVRVGVVVVGFGFGSVGLRVALSSETNSVLEAPAL